MTFSEDYEALEHEFCLQVGKDNKELGIESTFLHNIRPQGPVDFVLIAMEPSTGVSLKETGHSEENPQITKNFSWSTEDFILHFCIRKYLCQGEQTYYLTDLSKGAMKVGGANAKRQQKYERWFPLLKRELRLVAKPRATRIIAIGNVVADFLRHERLCERIEKVLHYSPQAARYRKEGIQRWIERLPKFCQNIDRNAFEETIKGVLEEAYEDGLPDKSLSSWVQKRIKEHRHVSKLMSSDSKKMLMFYYKNMFENIRTAPHIVLGLDRGDVED